MPDQTPQKEGPGRQWPSPDRKPPVSWWQVRNVTLFVCGLLGVLHETLWANGDRPTLLLLFAAMMGLPAFLPNGGKK